MSPAGRWGEPTLARRLVIGTTLVTAGAVALGAVLTWWLAWWNGIEMLDAHLLEMQAMGRSFHHRQPPPEQPGQQPEPPPPEPADVPGGPLRRFIAADGTIHRQSAHFPHDLPPLADSVHPATWHLPSGNYRVLLLAPAQPGVVPVDRPGGGLAVEIAFDLAPLAAEGRRLALMLGLLWLASTVLAAISTFILARFLVAPVARLSRQIAAIDEHNLAVRLDHHGPGELRPVIEHTNALLARLEQAFAREKETISTIAHELRTPVTIQRGCLEFALLDGDRPMEAAMARRCLAAALTMQRLIEDLLSLARLEAGQERPGREQIDLLALMRRGWEQHQVRATARRLILVERGDGVRPAPILGTPGLTETAVTSLLGNAIDHAPAGDEIVVSWAEDAAMVHLTIANRLPQVGAAGMVSTTHLGLGLPLCRRILAVLGGHLEHLADHGRYTVTASLPREPAGVPTVHEPD